MTGQSTIMDLLRVGDDDNIALSGLDRPALNYYELRAQVARTVAELNDLGIGRNDRVAIVLPNGPEMATAFISVASGATTAPLNPAYKKDEFDFYLSDLGAKALLVEEGSESPAIEAALERNIQVLDLCVAENAPAGAFSLRPRGSTNEKPAANGGLAQSQDIALVLHTSGTTSRPKIVPLTHANVCTSAHNIQNTLNLDSDDVARTAAINP